MCVQALQARVVQEATVVFIDIKDFTAGCAQMTVEQVHARARAILSFSLSPCLPASLPPCLPASLPTYPPFSFSPSSHFPRLPTPPQLLSSLFRVLSGVCVCVCVCCARI